MAAPLEAASTPPLDSELVPLVRELTLAEGFTLAFVRCNVPVESERLVQSLTREMEAHGRSARVLRFDEPVVDLLGEIEDLEPPLAKNETLSVLGFERSIPAGKVIPPALARLNLVRERFRELPGSLVLVLPDYALTQLSRQAPDFWAWRSGVFEVAVPEATVERVFQEFASEDPYWNLSFKRKEEHRAVLAGLLDELKEKGPEVDSRRLDLLLRLGELSGSLRDYERARSCAEAARQIAERLGKEREKGHALDLLARTFANFGEYESAFGVAEKAVEVYSRLADHSPEALLPDLSKSLHNLGITLSALGRREEALDATQRAAAISKKLAQERPEVFLPDLATSLNNLGSDLSALGRMEEAFEAVEAAVDIRRKLAKHRPDAFLPSLASSLNNLGAHLSSLDRKEEALAATQEAVEVRKKLANERPEVFLPDLASSLANLGNRLSDLGRQDEGLAASQEAVRILLPFFRRLPWGFAAQMRNHLVNYLKRVEATGGKPDFELINEVKEIFERNLAVPPA